MQIALAIILHPDKSKVLIAQRQTNVHLPNMWEFPGGKRLPGEAPAECAVREAFEETGLEVSIREAWPVIIHAYPERTVTLHPFLCQARTADAVPRASQAVAWVRMEEIGEYEFPEANASLLLRLQSVNFTG